MDYNTMEEERVECIICFDQSTCCNRVQPIENFYILPSCDCSYNVHPGCIKEWQIIQQQEQTERFRTRELFCLKCNSPVTIRENCWQTPQCRNNMHILCIIYCSIGGVTLILLLMAFLAGK